MRGPSVHFGQLWGLAQSGINGEDVDTMFERVASRLTKSYGREAIGRPSGVRGPIFGFSERWSSSMKQALFKLQTAFRGLARFQPGATGGEAGRELMLLAGVQGLKPWTRRLRGQRSARKINALISNQMIFAPLIRNPYRHSMLETLVGNELAAFERNVSNRKLRHLRLSGGRCFLLSYQNG